MGIVELVDAVRERDVVIGTLQQEHARLQERVQKQTEALELYGTVIDRHQEVQQLMSGLSDDLYRRIRQMVRFLAHTLSAV